jgi:thioredoxin reductase (NADPH)
MSKEPRPLDETGIRQPAAGAYGIDNGAIGEAPGLRNHPRYDQMFPTLTDVEIQRVRRFGRPCHYARGELLYRNGVLSPGMFVLLSGAVRIVGRDGLGHECVLHTYMQGGFTSEIGQLSNRPALVDAHVVEDVEALLVRPEGLRAMMVSEAELGEKILRALILRRGLAIERGEGVVLISAPNSARLVALQNFLRRNSCPHMTLDIDGDADAIALLEKLTPVPDDFPLVLCPNGAILRNPDEGQLASCLGLIPEFDPAHVYDVAIIGAGPAGLAAAVYAASEGLSVAVLDCRAPGGQAGTSARIENYLGFPTGISGQALAGRAFAQAQKFGAHIGIPCEVKALHCGSIPLVVEIADARRVMARTVVIATGAEYRRPAVDGLTQFEDRGVYYWATPIEARLCRSEPAVIVGGGNSAGQAAVFLALHAEHVHMFIRGATLEHSMSRYLIERVASLPNVTLHMRVELTELEGGERLERVRYRGAGGVDGSMTTHHVFMFVGADPNTSWLKTCEVSVDSSGFILTGDIASHDRAQSLPLQTNVEGVFAIGDVRSGSTKRVASAVGEGAAVVGQIHSFLAAVR